ncbi:MAG: hypothetical protein WC473_01280 [Patescibacteria group bacterium]
MLKRRAQQRKKLALVISLALMAPLMLILAILNVQAENQRAKQQSLTATVDQQSSPVDMKRTNSPEANKLSQRYLSGMRGPDSFYLERAEQKPEESKE